jgi:hypothetical protein
MKKVYGARPAAPQDEGNNDAVDHEGNLDKSDLR